MEYDNNDLDKVFLSSEIIPDASNIFKPNIYNVESAISDSIIVLDTNVLLIPYGAGARSLSEIVEVYKKIKDRLIIPAQVAREFSKNRQTKLSELHQGLSDKVSQIVKPQKLKYPILEELHEFKELNDCLESIAEEKNKATELTSSVKESIKKWVTEDPVTKAYSDVFKEIEVYELKYDKNELYEELLRRYELNIPPGYKDSQKDDNGIGDYLIWKIIIELGKEKNKDVIFVTGEEKSDWQQRSGGQGLFPRYELQSEFKAKTNGKNFYLIPLSKLLELQEAETSSVEEIKNEEDKHKSVLIVRVECPECLVENDYEIGDYFGATAHPYCYYCDVRFNLHNTKDGIITRKMSYNLSDKKKIIEEVVCPMCGTGNHKELGMSKNATSWCVCDDCEYRFPIHRRKDGSVFVSTAPQE